MKIKKYFSEILSVSAIIIAIVTAVTTIIQTRDNKKHNILSVRPHLNTIAESSQVNKLNKYKYNVVLKNSGIGPAFISNIKYQLNGKELESSKDFDIIFKNNLKDKLKDFKFDYSLLISEFKTNVLHEGEQINIVQLNIYPKNSKLSNLERKILYDVYLYFTNYLSKIRTTIDYKSLYEISYTYDSE